MLFTQKTVSRIQKENKDNSDGYLRLSLAINRPWSFLGIVERIDLPDAVINSFRKGSLYDWVNGNENTVKKMVEWIMRRKTVTRKEIKAYFLS